MTLSIEPGTANRGDTTPQLGSKTADKESVLVCMNCARPILFEEDGWKHLVEPDECVGIVVAWPPPVADEDESAA